MEKLTSLDLSVLKYYKEGKELSGFEKREVYYNLFKLGFLGWDLELTDKGYKFIKEFKDWNSVTSYENPVVIVIKPKLS